MFAFNVLRGRMNSPCLSLKLRLNEPVRLLRREDFLLLDRHRTNYGLFEPVTNVSRTFNLFSNLYDSLVTRGQFRKDVRLMTLTNEMLMRQGFLLEVT